MILSYHTRANYASYFCSLAKGSASEVQSQLYVALDLKNISDIEFKRLYELSEETISLISGFIRHLKGKASS